MNEFDQKVYEHTGEALRGIDMQIIQVNVGLVCNQECVHCHVSSSPRRKEVMSWEIMELILEAARKIKAQLVDLTGGAPELNPHFRRFVEALRAEGFPVQARTNLTIMLEEGFRDLPEWYSRQRVQLVASLPCYLAENVAKQRGSGVYEKSVEAMKRLNAVGYGIQPELPLNLVYNPIGPYLPPDQLQLEADYRRELQARFGLSFTRLHTITNMPIGRFRVDLRRGNQEADYMNLLVTSFNPMTLVGLMCRHQVNIDWDGTLYDCDFNLALRLPVDHGVPNHIRDFEAFLLNRREIVTGDHCFGCTARGGFSCRGAVL